MTDNRSPEEIERELERDRAGLADTLDDLREKFSVDTMIRQAADQIREHSGEIGESVSRAVKTNPMALALTGVGLTWLIFSERNPAPVPAPDDWPAARGAHRPFRTRRPVSVQRSRGLAQPSDLPSWARDVDDMHGDMDTDDDKGLGAVKSKLQDTAESIKDRAASWRERLAEGTEHLTEEGRVRVIEARERATEAREAALDRLADARDRSMDMFEDHPLIAGALAVAVGAAIGAALPHTRFEDEHFGVESDELFREAERILKEESAGLKSAVAETAREAGETARKAASSAEKTASGQGSQGGTARGAQTGTGTGAGMRPGTGQRTPGNGAS